MGEAAYTSETLAVAGSKRDASTSLIQNNIKNSYCEFVYHQPFASILACRNFPVA